MAVSDVRVTVEEVENRGHDAEVRDVIVRWKKVGWRNGSEKRKWMTV